MDRKKYFHTILFPGLRNTTNRHIILSIPLFPCDTLINLQKTEWFAWKLRRKLVSYFQGQEWTHRRNFEVGRDKWEVLKVLWLRLIQILSPRANKFVVSMATGRLQLSPGSSKSPQSSRVAAYSHICSDSYNTCSEDLEGIIEELTIGQKGSYYHVDVISVSNSH